MRTQKSRFWVTGGTTPSLGVAVTTWTSPDPKLGPAVACHHPTTVSDSDHSCPTSSLTEGRQPLDPSPNARAAFRPMHHPFWMTVPVGAAKQGRIWTGTRRVRPE